MDWPTVRGNADRRVSGPDPATIGRDPLVYHQLTEAQRHWLAALPVLIDLGHGIIAFHSTPADDDRILLSGCKMENSRDRAACIHDRIGATKGRILLCGHSHQPHFIQLPDGSMILNPGSIGLSETGSPHARYAVLARVDKNGRPEWAHTLRTGFRAT